jgi:hypothetical protein
LEDEEIDESEMDSYFDTLEEEDLADNDHFEDFDNHCHELEGIRCAAHTLQLAVMDALKMRSYSELIGKVRRVARKLKTQNIQMVLDKLKLKHAILDYPTRYSNIS